MADKMWVQMEVINQQIKEIEGIYRGAFGRMGISENEFWIWYALTAMSGEYSQQDICCMWSLPKQTVNTIIMHMTRKNLVSLEAVPGSRNRKVIRLTEAGREYGKEIVLPILEAEHRAFRRLPEENRTAFTVAIGRYISILREEIHGTETK